MTWSGTAISARGMRKSFGEHTVLDDVDLEVGEGAIFALLGPNGAGKTTIVRILSTLIRAEAGTIRVAGHDLATDPDGVRAAIGVTGQFSAVDNLLTGAARKPLSAYSGGMRRRLDLAMTLVGDPRLIFLDEPTTGLDPRSRRTMWQIIRELAADGVTIFLTTQYLDEADQLADRVAVLDHGHIVTEGTPDELKRRIPGGHVQLRFAGPHELSAAAALLPAATPDPDQLSLQVFGDGSVTELRGLLNQLAEAGIGAERLSIHTPDLDDVFFAVTGHPTGTDREKASQL